MIYWIIYDIGENKSRTKVASLCKDYGLFRVQKSAFLGSISKSKIQMLALELKKLLKKNSDCVFILPTCNKCFTERIIQGKFDENTTKEYDFIIIGAEDE